MPPQDLSGFSSFAEWQKANKAAGGRGLASAYRASGGTLQPGETDQFHAALKTLLGWVVNAGVLLNNLVNRPSRPAEEHSPEERMDIFGYFAPRFLRTSTSWS